MFRRLVRLALPVLLIAELSPFAVAQTTTATLSGVVRDPQGGVVPGASVSVVQIETGQVRQTFGAKGMEAKLTIPLTHERWPAVANSE